MSDYSIQGYPRRVTSRGNVVDQAPQVDHGQSPQEEKKISSERKSQPVQNSLADLRLKFRVDPDSNDVTVLIMDKATDKVIRTIPPEELKNLREGGLIELTT